MRVRVCATPIEVSDTNSAASKSFLIFIFLSSRDLNPASNHESSRQRNLTAGVYSRQGGSDLDRLRRKKRRESLGLAALILKLEETYRILTRLISMVCVMPFGR